ncbi:Fes1-domain-containing protein [Venustampulla echinocandica]|uniref:Fes1-domain-containing protein n=1 Tax=Venustampulla echinocandica TaxID=2656787 RepID=A0A370TIV1_9HELO|nr:Fes1-domain-containing protein [Venustampulla echinocandica]RDL35299.1 Fes1-domain-containing protein [Venustampulla echinocandica]
MDPGLNQLLKWSVENTTANPNADSTPPTRDLNPDAINSLFGGPSDADLMRASMSAITSTSSELSLDDKIIAFDNFEQLIENLDNANNLEPLALWTPLLDCLRHEEKELRRMAAWCVGTAVQNNVTSQERLLAMGGVEKLLHVVLGDNDTTADEVNKEDVSVRRKAIYALSSAVRNYQPAMDVLTGELEKRNWDGMAEKPDAADMDAVDDIIGKLRDGVGKDIAS